MDVDSVKCTPFWSSSVPFFQAILRPNQLYLFLVLFSFVQLSADFEKIYTNQFFLLQLLLLKPSMKSITRVFLLLKLWFINLHKFALLWWSLVRYFCTKFAFSMLFGAIFVLYKMCFFFVVVNFSFVRYFCLSDCRACVRANKLRQICQKKKEESYRCLLFMLYMSSFSVSLYILTYI